MAGFAIKGGGKAGPKKVPTAPQHASFVLGSRPAGVRAPPVPRIKPVLANREYGKDPGQGATPSPSPFGDTGMTTRS